MFLTTTVKANYSQAQNNSTINILWNAKDIKIREKFKKKRKKKHSEIHNMKPTQYEETR
jgi:hypothetical protein